MYKELLFFILIMDLDFVAEASFPGYFSSHAVKAGEKLPSLDAGIDLKIDAVAFLKLLKVLT